MGILSFHTVSAVAVLALLATPPSANAFSGNTNNSQNQNTTDESGSDAPTCKKGYVYNKKTKTCVKMGSELIPDRDLYQQGRKLALDGRYQDALQILTSIHQPDDAMVYTMIGFADRKLGHFDEAMAMYQKALTIDPSNPNTHEYMGEAYIVAGRMDLAKIELSAVERGCGNQNCEQFVDLSNAIQTGKVE